MKFSIYFLLFCLFNAGHLVAQPLQAPRFVIEVNMPQDTLFQRILDWIEQDETVPFDTITFQNPVTGRINASLYPEVLPEEAADAPFQHRFDVLDVPVTIQLSEQHVEVFVKGYMFTDITGADRGAAEPEKEREYQLARRIMKRTVDDLAAYLRQSRNPHRR